MCWKLCIMLSWKNSTNSLSSQSYTTFHSSSPRTDPYGTRWIDGLFSLLLRTQLPDPWGSFERFLPSIQVLFFRPGYDKLLSTRPSWTHLLHLMSWVRTAYSCERLQITGYFEYFVDVINGLPAFPKFVLVFGKAFFRIIEVVLYLFLFALWYQIFHIGNRYFRVFNILTFII